MTTVNISGGNTNFTNPVGVGVDGAGNVWTANYGGKSVTELTKSSNYSASSAVNISGSVTGFIGPKILAVDTSGNIWVSNG
ncbi:MAG: hypothetical protein ACYDCY_10790, partial [Metallibacterium sp.]